MVNISNSHLGPGDPRGAGHCGLPSLLLPDLPCPSPQGTSNGLGSIDDIETGSVRGVRGQVEMGSWGGLSPISPRPLGGQASQAPPLQIRAPEGSLPWGLPEAWKQIVGSGKASPFREGRAPPQPGRVRAASQWGSAGPTSSTPGQLPQLGVHLSQSRLPLLFLDGFQKGSL